jgi:SAM-dependent methyltransferase
MALSISRCNGKTKSGGRRLQEIGAMNPRLIIRVKNFVATCGIVDSFRWLLLGVGIRASNWILRAIAPKDRFDARHNVDTEGMGVIWDVEQLTHDPRHAGAEYWPTRYSVVRHLITSTRKRAKIDVRDFCFVDYGSGKGRVLLIASELPFARIVGVEWSQSLVDIAKVNLQECRGLRRQCKDISFFVGDAREYRPSAENSILFMANPFGQKDPSVLRDVLRRIDDSFRASSKKVILIFLDLEKPLYDVLELIRQRDFCHELAVHENLHPSFSWAVAKNFGP